MVSDRKKRVESLDKRRVAVKQACNAQNDTRSIDPIENMFIGITFMANEPIKGNFAPAEMTGACVTRGRQNGGRII